MRSSASTPSACYVSWKERQTACSRKSASCWRYLLEVHRRVARMARLYLRQMEFLTLRL